MNNTADTSVVVIGGSIVGLCSALFLAQQHVPFILVERHPGSSLHPRALGYTSRTMELFRTIGVDKRIPQPPAGGATGRPRRVTTRTLNGEWSEETHWTAASGSNKSGGGPPDMRSITPAGQTAIAQDALEPILRNRALEMGADLRLGWEMTQWSQNDESVRVTATSPSGDTLEIRAKYMIACDGARSRVRSDLSIATHGVGYLRTLRSILFRCPSIDHYVSRGISQWSIDNEGFEAFLVTYRDGRWALMSYDADQDALDQEGQRAIICKAIGDDLHDIELLTQGKWDLSGSIADRFSTGRVFLAGDAAHALPPNRGGYGANTGIADAHNLAWKLAAVLSGRSDTSLLNTYDKERRAVALVRHDQIFARDDYKAYVGDGEWSMTRKHVDIIDDVAMELGQLYRSDAITGSEDETLPEAKTPAQWNGHPGTRAPHIELTRDGNTISTIDLFCNDWVVLSKAVEWRSHVRDVPDVRVILINTDVSEAAEGSFARSYGVEDGGAVLVRPDGYIAARWVAASSPKEFSSAFKKVAHVA